MRGHTERDDASLSKFSVENYAGRAYDMLNKVFCDSRINIKLLSLEKLLFYFLIFSIPFQRRAIIYTFGTEFNEWNSAFLYFTDILIFGIFALWLPRLRKTKIDLQFVDFILLSFLVFSFLSFFTAKNQFLTIYQFLKLVEFICLFFYIKFNFNQLFDFKKILQIFIASGLLQAVIAISQFFSQKSLGLYIFEESILGPQGAGVAKIDMSGFELLRSYGTFPHANPLAVFLSLSIFCLILLYALNGDKYNNFFAKLIFVVCSWFLVFALFLTFSRAIIILTIILFIAYFVKARKKIIPILLLINIIVSFLMLYPELNSRFNPTTLVDSQAVNFRLFYNQIALSMIKDSPFFGIGLGNYVWRMSEFNWNLDLVKGAFAKDGFGLWIYQPAHNIFLLIGSEIGLIGLAFFIIFLFLIFKNAFNKLLSLKSKIFYLSFILSFLSLFFIDHYLWTLQQGSLLLWVGLGIIYKSGTKT